jgi:pyruvate formate lyase activating enzyme
MTPQQVMDTVLKDVRYYETSGGGMTLSGGEPLAQFEYTAALLKSAKEHNIHTCIETSGYGNTERLLSLVPYVDIFLFDYKESDDENHKQYTGVPRERIQHNLHAINNAGAKIILRCPIIPGYNDRPSHFAAIAATANQLSNVLEINLMPYHPLGASKAKRIGMEYALADVGFPSEEKIGEWRDAVAKGTAVKVT